MLWEEEELVHCLNAVDAGASHQVEGSQEVVVEGSDRLRVLWG